MDQWNRMVSVEINMHTYRQIFFDKGERNIHTMGKRQSFQQWCWEIWTAACEPMKLEHTLTSYIKINSKWLKDICDKIPIKLKKRM